LNFSSVNWASGLSLNDETALELALNISGSFEGNAAWANLTNDFDGEGLSMGLLNQTLGTGSLQPLLIQMRDLHMNEMGTFFDSTRFNSLISMLAQWESSQSSSLVPEYQVLSLLDVIPLGTNTATVTPNQASVNWALANLYTDSKGQNFDPTWAADLTALTQNPDYVSLQIDAAMDLHNQALSEETLTGVNELRSYLFMFDVNVQDGGMYSQDWTDFKTWLQSNASATDTDRLNELLTLRLRHVRSAYVSDVQSRKQAIINGQGFVHGDQRNLETQYCFDRLVTYP
jgi:hypothetical protein